MTSLIGVVHGTADGYKNHGCRCDACTNANAGYMRAKYTVPCVTCRKPLYMHGQQNRARVKARSGMCPRCWREATGQYVHGTEGGYTRGCRCDPCRTAANIARTRRRKTPNVKVHNRNGYTSGCRCDICLDAQMAYLWRRGE